MKLGLSTYSLSRAIQAKQMDVLQAIQWIKNNGGEHVEIVPVGFSLDDNPALIDAIREKARKIHIDISNYAIGANFITDDQDAYEREIERVMRQVDIAHRLGIKSMRHDVAWRPIPESGIMNFEADLPRLVEACQQIADYAAQYGMTTNVENHGFYVQASDRVQRLVELVNRPNFKTILDIGNFMCVDQDPVVSVKKNLPYAFMIHLKDFYLRPAHQNPGEGWFRTAGDNYLRGAIVGQGDMDMRTILSLIKKFGYNGYISLEFEGMEDCLAGSKIGLDNARRIWEEV
jgi:inosose dehydratase